MARPRPRDTSGTMLRTLHGPFAVQQLGEPFASAMRPQVVACWIAFSNGNGTAKISGSVSGDLGTVRDPTDDGQSAE